MISLVLFLVPYGMLVAELGSIWVGGTLAATTIATLNEFVLAKPLGTTGEIIVGLIFTWVTVGMAKPAGCPPPPIPNRR